MSFLRTLVVSAAGSHDVEAFVCQPLPRHRDDGRLILQRRTGEINTVPEVGSLFPAAIWLLAYAAAKLLSMPITSPVDRISGPRITSTPGNLLNGKTASLTDVCRGS